MRRGGHGGSRRPGHLPRAVAASRRLPRQRGCGRIHLGHRDPAADRSDPPGGRRAAPPAVARGGAAGGRLGGGPGAGRHRARPAGAGPRGPVAGVARRDRGHRAGRPHLRGGCGAAGRRGRHRQVPLPPGPAGAARRARRPASGRRKPAGCKHTAAKPGGHHDQRIFRAGRCRRACQPGPAGRIRGGRGGRARRLVGRGAPDGLRGLPDGAGSAGRRRAARAEPLGAAGARRPR